MRHVAALERLRQRVVDGPGHLDIAVRRAAFHDGEIPDAMRQYVHKVIDHAYKVTDRDTEELLAAGYSQDEIFELTIAAATGAAMRRWDAGRRAIEA